MSEATTLGAGHRDRKKRQTRDAIEAAAWRLFARKGFDHTTIDDITAAADVSPRTFFRYFETKEAVLFGDWRGDLLEFEQRLRDRPAAETPLEALAGALLSFSDRFEADGPVHAQRARVVASSAHVSDYRREVIQPAWEDAMSSLLAARLGVDAESDLRPTLYAGVAVAALNAASSVWLAGGGTGSLLALLRGAFEEIAGVAATGTAYWPAISSL
jgi:TetR/AcrR family transcriptional regulator, regulator of mycofactocin system